MMESIEVEQEITHGLSIGLTPWYLTLDDLERWSQNFGIKYLEYRERYRRDQTHYNAVFATCKTSLCFSCFIVYSDLTSDFSNVLRCESVRPCALPVNVNADERC